MRVIILDNLHKGARYNSHWSIHIPDLIQSWGYETIVFTADYVRRLEVSDREKMISARLLEQFTSFIINDEIQNGDVIILPDARDHIAFPIFEMLIARNLDFKFMGFWQSGTYYSDGYIWKGFSKEQRHKMHFIERALTAIYDYNLMNSDLQYSRFKQYFYSRRKIDNLKKCGFPYSFMIEPDEEFVKEDIVVYNAGPQDKMNQYVFEYVKNEFPDYQFYVCNTESFTAQEYEQLLKRSKVLFNTNLSESNPWTILESMMYGAIPILPNYEIYDEIFPGVAKYDKKLLKPPYLPLVRNDEQIIGPIRNYMEDYDKFRDKIIVPERKRALEKYFNTEDLKNILCQINKK